MSSIADPLRDYCDWMEPLGEPCGRLREIADQIDKAYENRLEQCRRETRKYYLHRLRSMMNDMEHGIKWAKKSVKSGKRVRP